MEPVRVLIADDHPYFRHGLRALLLTASYLEVVGEAGDGEEAISLAAELQPDVILMNLNMAGVGSIEATRRILRTSHHIAILVISMFEDDDSIFAALQAGARGYLLKGALKAEILRSIWAVSSGEAIFGPTIAKRLMQYFASPHPTAPKDAFPELTERVREILTLIAQHETNPEFAKRIHLNPRLFATTSPTSSPNFRWRTAPSLLSAPARLGWGRKEVHHDSDHNHRHRRSGGDRVRRRGDQ